MSNRLRVLVVDDSAFFRRRIQEIISQSSALDVTGTANNGLEAVQAVDILQPDVITMDVEMPVLDGISAVRRIMARRPTPILMFSSLTQEGARATLDALDAGAVDFLSKDLGRFGDQSSAQLAERLCRKLIEVGHSKVARAPQAAPPSAAARLSPRRGNTRLVAIGASTGGPVALQRVLMALPAGFPLPLVMAVHMPAAFTPTFAERLNSLAQIRVKEASDGDPLQPGLALLAPGGQQLVVERRGDQGVARVRPAPPEQTYRPSVDMLFGSTAQTFPGQVLAIVLTGMGADGKQGAQLLKNGGSRIWSQDEASCVVYGMPQAVAKLADQVLPLEDIGPTLAKLT